MLFRRSSPIFALGLILLGGLLLAGCTKTDTLNARQTGVWHIRRLTLTSTPTSGPTTTRTVTDRGDIAFTDLAGDDNTVVVHADSSLPSRCLALISDDPSRAELPRGDYHYTWTNDPYSDERLVFSRQQGNLGLVAAATFTVTENKRDSQRWQYIESTSDDRIIQRETWELERVK